MSDPSFDYSQAPSAAAAQFCSAQDIEIGEKVRQRVELLSEVFADQETPVSSASKRLYFSLVRVAACLAVSNSGRQREVFTDAIEEYREAYPQLSPGLFVSALNLALFLDPAATDLSIRTAGPLAVLTDKSNARPGNPSGIVATTYADTNALTWAQGKLILKIAKQIEGELGQIVRNLQPEELLELRIRTRQLLDEQRKAQLFIPSIFRSRRERQLPCPTEAQQKIALLAKHPSILSGIRDTVALVSDIVSIANSVAFAEPANMSPLTLAGWSIFSESHPQIPRELYTTLLVTAMNEAVGCSVPPFHREIRGADQQIAVLKDARLCWRLNPEGCFAVVPLTEHTAILDFIVAKAAAMVEAALLKEHDVFDRCGPAAGFIEALASSVPIIGTALPAGQTH